MRAAALVLISAGNLILQTASYPPLPKTQGRGTHSFGPGKKSDAENLGHPPKDGAPTVSDRERKATLKTWATRPASFVETQGWVSLSLAIRLLTDTVK
jgi:hypothetical protein